MATTMKRETLKSIGNVPEWVLKQNRTKDGKKEPVKVARPRTAPKQPKVAAVVPSVTHVVAKPLVVPQPIKEAVKDPQDNGIQTSAAGSKVRRIYSREFLIKFKYSASSFPPGTPTPLDLIAQYNKEFEQRERLAQDNSSSLTPTKPTPTYVAPTPSQTESTPATVERKKLKRKEGEKVEGVKREKKETFKLRLGNTDDSILRSPLFRATAKTPVRHATPPSSALKQVVVEDKENSVNSVKAARPSSISKVRVVPSPATKKETSTIIPTPTTVPTPVFTPVAPAPAPISSPAPTPIATPAPAAVSTPAPQPEEDASMEGTKQDDLVDALTKKLKGVLKETDARRLAQRQKQIEYGKATLGYQDFTKQVAKSKRKREDPKTPNKYQVCSKRSWDGQVRKWRRMLHFYDPTDLKDGQTHEELDSKHFEITEADLLAEENALRE